VITQPPSVISALTSLPAPRNPHPSKCAPSSSMRENWATLVRFSRSTSTRISQHSGLFS
jgi:hypothetical protein